MADQHGKALFVLHEALPRRARRIASLPAKHSAPATTGGYRCSILDAGNPWRRDTWWLAGVSRLTFRPSAPGICHTRINLVNRGRLCELGNYACLCMREMADGQWARLRARSNAE